MRERERERERPRSWSHKATWRPRLEKEHDANISLSLSSLLFVSASLLAFSLLFVAMTWEEDLLPLQVFNLNLNGVVFFIHFYSVRIVIVFYYPETDPNAKVYHAPPYQWT